MTDTVRFAFVGMVLSLALAGWANKALSEADLSLTAQAQSMLPQSDVTAGVREMITLGAFGVARLAD